MITINNIKKEYNGNEVLNVSNLTIEKGESFGLVGNNGAGKSTLFRSILSLIKPTSGEVFINNIQVDKSENWKNFTGSYLDEGFLIDFLSPEEYLDFVAKTYKVDKLDKEQFITSMESFFNDSILGKKKLIRDLSKGNQKKVGIAAAMMSKPEVLLLDEPFTNLDPTTQIRLKQLIINYQEENQATVVVSSHDLNHVTEVCKRIVVMENGQVINDIATESDTLEQLHQYFAV